MADSRAVAKKAQEELDYLVRESEAVLGVTGRAKGAQKNPESAHTWFIRHKKTQVRLRGLRGSGVIP